MRTSRLLYLRIVIYLSRWVTKLIENQKLYDYWYPTRENIKGGEVNFGDERSLELHQIYRVVIHTLEQHELLSKDLIGPPPHISFARLRVTLYTIITTMLAVYSASATSSATSGGYIPAKFALGIFVAMALAIYLLVQLIFHSLLRGNRALWSVNRGVLAELFTGFNLSNHRDTSVLRPTYEHKQDVIHWRVLSHPQFLYAILRSNLSEDLECASIELLWQEAHRQGLNNPEVGIHAVSITTDEILAAKPPAATYIKQSENNITLVDFSKNHSRYTQTPKKRSKPSEANTGRLRGIPEPPPDPPPVA